MKKSIPVELDKQRNLRYGYEAISYIEQKLGRPIAKVKFDNLTILDLATLIAGGLIHESPNYTPDMVIKTLDEYEIDLTYIAQKMEEAMRSAFDTGKK